MSTTISPRHQAALDWAEAGVPVFPCRPGTKLPAVKHWKEEATLDPGQIDAWWGITDFNLALHLGAAGLSVVDLDGRVGQETWANSPGSPDTYTQRTPGGGYHLVYTGSCRNSVSTIGVKIDTRGVGGYILAAPSIVDGRSYEVIDDRDFAPFPAWVVERLAKTEEAKTSAPDVDLDDPGNVLRAIQYLENAVPALSGAGGNNRTYQVACAVRDFGISEDKTLELLEDYWNPRCQPPWEREELTLIIANTAEYGQNELGAWAVPPSEQVFAGPNLERALAESKTEAALPKRSRFYAEDETEQEQGEEPSWLVEKLMPDQSTVLLYGPTGSWKSSVALDLALSIATKTETFGSLPTRAGPVFYAALEGRVHLKKKRRRAWKLLKGVGACPDFYIMPAPMLVNPPDIQEFGDEIKRRCNGRQPALIVLDTVAKCMVGLNENDAADAGRFIRFCDSLVEAFKCPVVAIGHTGKDDSRGHRGSGAFQAGFDTVVRVEADRKARALTVRVEKHKDAEEPADPWFLKVVNLADSMAVQQITKAEHAALVSEFDAFDRRAIGEALQALGAIGDKTVTTHVLAVQITPQLSGESPDERDQAVRKVESRLRALAKGKLEAYQVKPGQWALLEANPE